MENKRVQTFTDCCLIVSDFTRDEFTLRVLSIDPDALATYKAFLLTEINNILK
jgi:hypothetical protein